MPKFQFQSIFTPIITGFASAIGISVYFAPIIHAKQFSDFQKIAGGAIKFEGGDRKTLTPAGHKYNYNNIVGIQRRHYYPAINGTVVVYTSSVVTNMGVDVSHNTITDLPYIGILGLGAFSTCDSNTLTRVCKATVDTGAIYNAGRWGTVGDPSQTWGTKIRFNTISYVYCNDWDNGTEAGGGNVGIYLDDGCSGATVSGNVISQTIIPILIGGGSYNQIMGNSITLSGTTVGPFSAPTRWLTWDGRYLPNSWAGDSDPTWRTSTDTGSGGGLSPGSIDLSYNSIGLSGAAWISYASGFGAVSPSGMSLVNNRHKVPYNDFAGNLLYDSLNRDPTDNTGILSCYPIESGKIKESHTNGNDGPIYASVISLGVTVFG